jgi:endonuclease/exonuclease/phosphatase family metal-dependent hydrolase
LAEQPEVICLTEARWDSLQSFGGHLLDIRGFGWAPETVSDDEREVLLWSHEPWADVVLGGGDDLERGGFIAATTTTSVGKIRVIGICVPYHMARVPSEKQWSEQIRFLKSLGGFLGKQARRLPTVILGDFNQLIPRTWGSADADLARVEALDGFVVCTHGVISGADYAYVDHVALDESLKAVSIHAIEQENNGARLTGEHFGVVVRLQHVEAPTAYSRLT